MHGEIKTLVEFPKELEVWMATVNERLEQLVADVQSLHSETSARFDTIDNVLEELRASGADPALLDQLAAEVQAGRDAVAAVNPQDPSGDDVSPPA